MRDPVPVKRCVDCTPGEPCDHVGVAIMDPRRIPSGRDHLEADDRGRLQLFESALDANDLEAAEDAAEQLWSEAVDAHRRLYQGLANAVTAALAHRAGQLRGAAEIAAATRELFAPYPRTALGLDLDRLLGSLDRLVAGDGSSLEIRP